jgi:hypothetical protein
VRSKRATLHTYDERRLGHQSQVELSFTSSAYDMQVVTKGLTISDDLSQGRCDTFGKTTNCRSIKPSTGPHQKALSAVVTMERVCLRSPLMVQLSHHTVVLLVCPSSSSFGLGGLGIKVGGDLART